jgi:serine/threonine protein kinase
MIDTNGYLKLIDFGTAKKLKKNFTSTIIGTPNFIAPEILLKNNYSFSCDFWSIGVIIFYVFYGFLPFGNKAVEIMEIYKEIIDKKIVFKKETPFEILNLLNGLLQKNPNERMCNKEKIKNLNVFNNFDWELLKLGKIKPFCTIEKDKRINEENLNILNSPFNVFMENESFETGQMQSLKIYNKKKESFSNISKWFENF